MFIPVSLPILADMFMTSGSARMYLSSRNSASRVYLINLSNFMLVSGLVLAGRRLPVEGKEELLQIVSGSTGAIGP